MSRNQSQKYQGRASAADRRSRAFWLPALLLAVAFFFASVVCSTSVAAPGKLALKVLYAGDPKTERQKDFVAFLKDHFTTAEGGDIEKFKETDAPKYDVVILDYGPLKETNKVVTLPKFSFAKTYSQPTITLGKSGGKVCSALKLKTGYL